MIRRVRDGDHTPARTPDHKRGDARWPTLTQVEAARDDAGQLLAWSRSLPAADTDDQRDLISKVVRYLTPAIRRAEKAAAWHVTGSGVAAT